MEGHPRRREFAGKMQEAWRTFQRGNGVDKQGYGADERDWEEHPKEILEEMLAQISVWMEESDDLRRKYPTPKGGNEESNSIVDQWFRDLTLKKTIIDDLIRQKS